MSQDFKLMRDILEEHTSRMLNIKKYYPFFKIQESSLIMFRDGKYAFIDIGYITMAILRFFIEENNFKDREVTYQSFYEFTKIILRRDFDMKMSDEDEKEIIDYIFDKLKNDGKPFYMDYFDPIEKQKKTARMKLIDSTIWNQTVTYTITADAIEFYLDTKEIKEESKISIQQLLLEKMICSHNFRGGIDVVRRINNEVNKLRLRKKEVLTILSANVFEGVKALEDFVDVGLKWFEEEQRLFIKNKELIDKALEKAEHDTAFEVLEEIYMLETELKKAISKHSELLADCTELQMRADEIIQKSKLSRLRNAFDFTAFMECAKREDDMQLLEHIISPMVKLNIKKTFAMSGIEDLITYKMDNVEEGEKIQVKDEVDYIYPDEEEENRIEFNFKGFLKTLLDLLLQKGEFDLREFNQVLEIKYFDMVFKNSDYYSFLVHLCQKKEYDLDEIRKEQDTFLDGILKLLLDEQTDRRYKGLKFKVVMSEELSEDTIMNHQVISAEEEVDFSTSNILFERMEI